MKYNWPAEVMGSAKSLDFLKQIDKYILYLFCHVGLSDSQIQEECGLSPASDRNMKRRRRAILRQIEAAGFPDPEDPSYEFQILLKPDLSPVSSSEEPPHS